MLQTPDSGPRTATVAPLAGSSVLVAGHDEQSSATVRLVMGLRDHGLSVTLTRSVADTVTAVRDGRFAVAIVGNTMVDGSSTDVCCRLRAAGSTLPVLAYVANDCPTARIAPLQAGADDCISGRMHDAEVLARTLAVLRWARRHTDATR